MLVKSNQTNYTELHNYSMEPAIYTPSTIIWTQTLNSITLHIQIQHVDVSFSQRCLRLSNKLKTITLPLFGSVQVNKNDIECITNSRCIDTTVTIRLIKDSALMWPHLLMQQTDEEMQRYLLEANLSIQIAYQPIPSRIPSPFTSYDTLDFETVISGHGEKTGLE